jgi:hypothetical protein
LRRRRKKDVDARDNPVSSLGTGIMVEGVRADLRRLHGCASAEHPRSHIRPSKARATYGRVACVIRSLSRWLRCYQFQARSPIFYVRNSSPPCVQGLRVRPRLFPPRPGLFSTAAHADVIAHAAAAATFPGASGFRSGSISGRAKPTSDSNRSKSALGFAKSQD